MNYFEAAALSVEKSCGQSSLHGLRRQNGGGITFAQALPFSFSVLLNLLITGSTAVPVHIMTDKLLTVFRSVAMPAVPPVLAAYFR